MRRCDVAGGGCEIDGRYTCYKCGNSACGECSAIRQYLCYETGKGRGWKYRPRRICNDCWKEECKPE